VPFDQPDALAALLDGLIEVFFNILMAAIYAARVDPPAEPLSLLHAKIIFSLSQICELHSASEHAKLRNSAREMLLDWTVILRQVREPHLPLTNNTAERILRHWVISRLISHGTRSADGTRAFALLASVIETCRLGQASPWHYLATVIAASRRGLILPSWPIMPALAGGV
jgi:transposase